MTDADRPSFLDMQRDAALTELRERATEHRRIAELVIPSTRRGSDKRVTDITPFGGDYLVEVTDQGDVKTWTFVVGGKAINWFHRTMEEATLHLIATRHDPNPNSNVYAAFYAGRVLGVPATNA